MTEMRREKKKEREEERKVKESPQFIDDEHT